MVSKSWIVTVVPLIVYVLSFSYSIVTGTDFSDNQTQMLETLFYGFLGAGAIGAGKSTIEHFKKAD